MAGSEVYKTGGSADDESFEIQGWSGASAKCILVAGSLQECLRGCGV